MPNVLPNAGVTTFYADESDNKAIFVIACVGIPTVGRAGHALVDEWREYYEAARAWRAGLKRRFDIPVAKELKGSKLATGHNRYAGGRAPLYGMAAIEAYRAALSGLGFLPDASVFSDAAPRGYVLYGHTRLEAALFAMFQRIQRHCTTVDRAALMFFDEGHEEYRTLFRRARVYLPTGSRVGAWQGGAASRNVPFATAIKDANFKDSRRSHFVQMADLVAYATLLKLKAEAGTFSPREVRLGAGSLHDSLPRRVLNVRVATGGTDGIKRLG